MSSNNTFQCDVLASGSSAPERGRWKACSMPSQTG